MPDGQRTRLEQLRRALELGAIDQDTFDAAVSAFRAQLEGGGAIAQGDGSVAVGAGSVAVLGDNSGTINLGLLIQQGARSGASAQDLRRAYLARILTQSDQLPLFAGDATNAQVRLTSVYTALLTQRSDGKPADPRRERAFAEDREKKLSALEVLSAERRLVLLGGPGSGKSTFVNFVALAMAGELVGLKAPNLERLRAPLPKEGGDQADPEPQRWDLGALLPVIVVLRDFASQLPANGAPADAQTLWRFICGRLKQAALEDYAPHLKEELLQRGGLVLLDGLDEVPDAHNRRGQIKQAVQGFAATFSRCRFLVTSRTYAYQRQDWKLDGFSEAHLLPFSLGQIRRFVDAWYGHMVELLRLTEPDARDRANVLQATVERNERLRELAERPLLLTLIAQLQTEGGGVLPEKREELYDRAVDMLLTRWESLKVRVREDGAKDIEPGLAEFLNAGRDDIRKQLNRLAFEAHRDQAQLTGTADIRQESLIAALLNTSARREEVNVGLLERYLRDRAGILAAHGVGMVQFPHRSFQEYLAACHLTDDDFPDKLAELVRKDPNRWREVTLLAAAKANRGSSLYAWTLAEELCAAPPPHGEAIPLADHWAALLAGRVLVECTDLAKVAPRNEDKRNRIREWQRTITRRNTLPATERALAGRSLAALGDPRPEVMTLDGLHFCLVPPGPFAMGSDTGRDTEKPQHAVDLDAPYFIGRFPVTVAQWQEYVQLSGQPANDERSRKGRSNDPVTFVSFHDAMGFCAFLSDAWRAILPAGFRVTLPSEAEWEKAARGGERVPGDYHWRTLAQLADSLRTMGEQPQIANPFPSRAYPWGKTFDAEKANVESAIGETSAVGCYPVGFSPYGCEEMAGNVWEWTRSLWGKDFLRPEFNYPYDPRDQRRENPDTGSDIYRVLRGGSWLNPLDDARCAFRRRSFPDVRYGGIGFQVVLRCSPVS